MIKRENRPMNVLIILVVVNLVQSHNGFEHKNMCEIFRQLELVPDILSVPPEQTLKVYV